MKVKSGTNKDGEANRRSIANAAVSESNHLRVHQSLDAARGIRCHTHTHAHKEKWV